MSSFKFTPLKAAVAGVLLAASLTAAATVALSNSNEEAKHCAQDSLLTPLANPVMELSDRVDATESDLDNISARFEKQFSITPYLVKPLGYAQLYVIFGPKGTFVTDSNVSIVIKGEVLNSANGDDVIAAIAKENKDVLINALKRSNNINQFFNETRPAVNQPTPAPASTVPVAPPAAAPIEPPAPVITKPLPKPLPTVMNPAVKTVNPQNTQVSTGSSVVGGSEDLIRMMTRMDPKDRLTEGPRIASFVMPKIPDSFFVIYEPAAGVEYRGTLTVASDITCSHCQEFHELIPTLQAEGVKVRLMPYPRARIIDFNFPADFTVEDYIKKTKSEPLNKAGLNVLNTFCTTNPAESYNQALLRKPSQATPAITPDCEQKVREFKVMGDLFFSNRTPYIVWGDANSDKDSVGFIEGVEKKDKNIDDLLKRLHH